MLVELISNFLIIYLFTSIIIFFFPNLIHSKKTYQSEQFQKALDHGKCLHISHRGGSREGLENTLPTFKNAVNLGTNVIELDVCMTKDGKIVVCHDKNLSRLCGINVNIEELNYNELPRHAPSVPLHFSVDIKCDTTQLDPYFPELEELFKAFPNTIFNMELKTAHSESIVKVGQLIQKYNREHITIWGCQSSKHTEVIKTNFPNAITFFSMERVIITYLYLIIGLLPFVYIKEETLQLPLLTHDYRIWKTSIENNIKMKLFLGLIKVFNMLDPLLFIHLKKRGIICMYWVINTEADYKRCLKQNIHGIITDKPTSLKEFLIKNNKYIENHQSKPMTRRFDESQRLSGQFPRFF